MSGAEVTVLMPVYNGGAFLKQAIESVLDQTYTQFEFLIINDGSGDDTEKIIRSFSDPRINYVRNEVNEGLIASLNKGLNLAKGKFIARMDADDICFPERLEEQLKMFRADPNLIAVGSDYFEFDEGGASIIRNENDSDYQKAILLFATCFAHPTVMMKNVFSSNGVYYDKNYIHTEDYKLWTELSFFGDFANVNKPLLRYRRHAGQITQQHRELQYEKSAMIRREYCERLGFNLTGEQYGILNKLGNNIFVTELKLLKEINDLLEFMLQENTRLKKFNQSSFLKCLHRFWLDICGHTNLGLAAYKTFAESRLAGEVPLTFAGRLKLLAKCLIRKFRS